jgi:hypothetical protein
MLADAGLLFDPHPLDRFPGIRVHNVFEPYFLVGRTRSLYTYATRNWFLALPQNFNQLNHDNSVLFIVRGEFAGPGDLIPGVTVESGPFHITGRPAHGNVARFRILEAQELLDEMMELGAAFDITAYVARTVGTPPPRSTRRGVVPRRDVLYRTERAAAQVEAR